MEIQTRFKRRSARGGARTLLAGRRALLWGLLLLAFPMAGQMGLVAQIPDWPRQVPEGAPLTDPISRLQQRIDLGEVQLEFDDERGYLDALLEELGISPASQSVVFSKTSLQAERISPDNPRALYFNDDVYLGWVRGGPIVEVASTDPRFGTIFYTLPQSESPSPRFEREGARCINCHLPSRSDVPIPRLMVMSVMPNQEGEAVGTSVLLTTDRSSTGSRWGGWYVTGTGGDAAHMGNMVLGGGRGPNWEPGGNRHLSDLVDRFDTSQYLTARSDVVALMLLVHQSEVHNLMGEAAYAVRQLEASGTTSASEERTMRRIGEAVEPLVRALFFADAVPVDPPVDRSSAFVTWFTAQGPYDSRGRSLRDLDLETRLLRHPLSYLVYSEAFDQLPTPATDYVYRRFREILEGRDASEEFSHLSDLDRTTLMEILLETKPAFRAWVETH